MSEQHPFVQTINKYYRGCSSANIELMKETFTDDVVHYFTHHAPIRGAQNLAEYWAKMQPRIQAVWTCDHALVDGRQCVIEWTMSWVAPGNAKEMIRGAEWYVFRDDRISEIRAYYINRHLPYDRANFELDGFPYEDRGYTTLGTP